MHSKGELSDIHSAPSSSYSNGIKRSLGQEEKNTMGHRELFLTGFTETIKQIINNSFVHAHFAQTNSLDNSSITFHEATTSLVSDLISMDSRFVNEDNSHYLNSDTERAVYLMHFEQGKLYNAKNELIRNNHLLYVLDGKNNLYGIPASYKWNHSWMLAGSPVKAAGFIDTDEEGDVIAISNESGHYVPTMVQMLPALRYFFQQVKQSISYLGAVLYESHDKAKEGLIVSYRLRDIARLNGLEDINNMLHKIPIKGKEYTKEQAIERVEQMVEGYDNDLDNSTQLVVSRYGMGPKV